MTKGKSVVFFMLVALAAAAGGALGFAALTGHEPREAVHAAWGDLWGEPEDDDILYYRHPHDPSITSDEPKQDSMGMDYIPVRKGEEDEAMEEDDDVVRLRPGVVQQMNVRTAEVEHGALARTVETVGHVVPDEGLSSRVDLRTEGWVEELRVRREGEPVAAGEVLFRYFSPRLITAQEEFLQALRRGLERDLESSRRRLRTLGMTPHQIARLEEDRQVREHVAVHAPRDGVVTRLEVREGDHLAPGSAAMEITDLSEVWVVANVFGEQGGWLAPGAPAEVRSRHLPGGPLNGEVEFIYPTLDVATRTTRVRMRFDNDDGSLKPGMYARVRLEAEATDHVTHVPREAVIRTGAQDRVLVALGEGRFQARAVEVGSAVGERIAVEGVESGERVVTSGQFLIDSEASVTAELARLEGAEPDHITARGVIDELRLEDGELVIHHEPVPEVDWPEMTMPFALAEDVEVEGLEEGGAVVFAFRQLDAMSAEITAIEKDERPDEDAPVADDEHDDGDDHDH